MLVPSHLPRIIHVISVPGPSFSMEPFALIICFDFIRCSESIQESNRARIELERLKVETNNQIEIARQRAEEEGTKLEREKVKVQEETAKHQLEQDKEKTRQQEIELQKEKEKTRQQELELQKAETLEKEKTKQHEFDEKKAHWEQMRADIQSKENIEQLRMKAALAEAQRKQAESAQQAIQEFRKLKDDGVGVTNHDLTSILHSIPQPRGYEQEYETRRPNQIWTAPILTLPEQDESGDQ